MTVTLVVQLPAPKLSAAGNVIDLTGPAGGPAQFGDVLRFTVVMTNSGAVEVANIHSTAFNVPPGVVVLSGSGAISGSGTGFVATDSRFRGGALAPGQSASYSLEGQVTPAVPDGLALFSLNVDADLVASIPVTGSMSIVSGAPPNRVIWLPIILR